MEKFKGPIIIIPKIHHVFNLYRPITLFGIIEKENFTNIIPCFSGDDKHKSKSQHCPRKFLAASIGTLKTWERAIETFGKLENGSCACTCFFLFIIFFMCMKNNKQKKKVFTRLILNNNILL